MQIRHLNNRGKTIELELTDGEQKVRIEYTDNNTIHITDDGPGDNYSFMIVDLEKKEIAPIWNVLR